MTLRLSIEETASFSVFGFGGAPREDRGSSTSAARDEAFGNEALVATEGGEGALDVPALSARVTKQASLVRELKKKGATVAEVESAVNELKRLRTQLDKVTSDATETKPFFNRKAFDELLKAKMFVIPAFEIHGGVAGLFDLGPPSCALKANLISLWRTHFVLEENMLEMECTNLTPKKVLATSGHVEKFTDLMVKDTVIGECFRADKLLEDFIDLLLENQGTGMTAEEREQHRRVQRQADAYAPQELHEIFQQYGIKSPTTGNSLSEPFPFNLMFQTHIGPEGTAVGYLRPETAQGLFVNFRRLLEFNNQKLPFAAAQVGLGFRNEISPRAGLLRVREFCMAEIEHFVNPKNKRHLKFPSVAAYVCELFSSEDQLGTGRTQLLSIGEAVGIRMIDNETLGYFMARTHQFLSKVGINPARMRFRQHLKTEMAHYASDCWDLEIETSYGWVECVGLADRSCYDLQVHSEATGVPMVASERLSVPISEEVVEVQPNKQKIGITFKKDQKAVLKALELLAQNTYAAEAFQAALIANGSAVLEGFTIERDMVELQKVTTVKYEQKFTPSVIEPSFGIGRILYAIMEHSFSIREADEQRNIMSFKPSMAPLKVAIFPLVGNVQLERIVSDLSRKFVLAGIASRTDTSNTSVGRRYARMDELGTPFSITVDFETDSTAQVRVPLTRIVSVVLSLVREETNWDTDIMKRYPIWNEEGDGSVLSLEKTDRAFFSRPKA